MAFKLLKTCPLILVLVFGLAQFKRPQRINPWIDPSQSLQASTRLPSEVGAILERSCGDCHSNATQWPWYSNVAPVSWFVADHVNHGRRHLNFSEWDSYDQHKQEKLLGAICEWVEKERMPLDSYTRIHHDAKVSDNDKNVLCNWVGAELERRSASRRSARNFLEESPGVESRISEEGSERE